MPCHSLKIPVKMMAKNLKQKEGIISNRVFLKNRRGDNRKQNFGNTESRWISRNWLGALKKAKFQVCSGDNWVTTSFIGPRPKTSESDSDRNLWKVNKGLRTEMGLKHLHEFIWAVRTQTSSISCI